MIRSMTGFGKGEYRDSTRQCTVEIKTVNHRYADYTVKMPREFLSLEDRIRHLLQQYIIRGKADIYITYTDLSPFSKVVAADEGLIQSYIDAIQETAQRHALQSGLMQTSYCRFRRPLLLRKRKQTPRLYGSCCVP